MKNNSNIYDIDGKIIRKIDDKTPWNISQVKEKIEYYRNKLKDLSEDDKKAVIYATYMRNLSNYLLILYSKMTPEELQNEVNLAKQSTTDEQIKKAMEELQKELENDTETTENTTEQVSESTTPTNNESNTNEKSGNDEVIDGGIGDIHEERPKSQSDLLVERDNVNTNMDEYTQFEELPVSDKTSKQFEEV